MILSPGSLNVVSIEHCTQVRFAEPETNDVILLPQLYGELGNHLSDLPQNR